MTFNLATMLREAAAAHIGILRAGAVMVPLPKTPSGKLVKTELREKIDHA